MGIPRDVTGGCSGVDFCVLVSSPYINVALDVASGVVIYTLVLDTSLAKAAVVYVVPTVIVMATVVLIGIASGKHSVSFAWDGHRHSLYSP